MAQTQIRDTQRNSSALSTAALGYTATRVTRDIAGLKRYLSTLQNFSHHGLVPFFDSCIFLLIVMQHFPHKYSEFVSEKGNLAKNFTKYEWKVEFYQRVLNIL